MIVISRAELEDLPAILDLQHDAYISEAEIYEDFNIQPLKQTLEELEQEFHNGILLKATDDNGKIVGSVRAISQNKVCIIGKLIVNRAYQNQGIGKKLMKAVENHDSDVNRAELFTGHKSTKNLALYESLGYSRFKEEVVNDSLTVIYLGKDI